ncbi:hypothetical protein [Amycolatopsis tolypomycina]|uniref:hypothetical protein n=1 Tax=Amycolatopsis tolypomycina TaxID=208445 RepID=UPI0033A79B92
MTDSKPPSLLPDAQELAHWVNAVALALRAVRYRQGRLAHADAEDAARKHEQRQHPPVRLMSDAELEAWRRRIPTELLGQGSGEPFGVWTARMVDGAGRPTGQWGLEAHTWGNRGGATSSLFVVLRDAEDALAMTRHLRELGTAEAIGRVHALATAGRGQFVTPPREPARGRGGAARLGANAWPLVLSEHEWETALRLQLHPILADQIIVKDPQHPHHGAWLELFELANEEVARVGADPAKLAAEVRKRPRWEGDVVNPPALAHWALTEARTHPRYPRNVTDTPKPAVSTRPGEPESAMPLRLDEVSSPEQALLRARSLDRSNPEHRLEAKQAFGRWGSQVDAILARKFPTVPSTAEAAARRERAKRGQPAVVAAEAPVAASAEQPEPEPEVDAATLRELEAEVTRFNPARRGDQMAAHAMLGHVPPEIDRLIAEKFAGDERIVAKVEDLYPDGLPEADAAMWRNRADGDDAAARAEADVADDPQTPAREDLDGVTEAAAERGAAVSERGIARSVAGTRPAHLRRTAQREPAAPVRRS